MRQKTIRFFKVQWSNHSEEEATWESDDFILTIRTSYHHSEEMCDCLLFLLAPFSRCKSWVKISFKGGGL
jgi:hypothetical protein